LYYKILAEPSVMPSFIGTSQPCLGPSRRQFLRAGTLALGAATLSLADILAATDPARRSRPKSIIHITLGGGPPHQDTFDLKPDAPAEIRGEFQPIATNVVGLHICEHFPRLSKMMDRFAVLRSITGAEARHDTFQCLTGWQYEDLNTIGRRPCVGAVAQKLLGPANPAMPSTVGLNHIGTWRRSGDGGFLGSSYDPFLPVGPGLSDMRPGRVDAERLQDRRQLAAMFDGFRRELDQGRADAFTQFQKQALEVVSSGRLVEALDLSREPERVRARYGDGKPYSRFILDGSPTANENFLLARRLVEAGVRVVTVPYGRWDSHLDNFENMRDHCPKLDQALSALIEDLEQRGLLDDVLVIAWGEFGRTPRINKDGGRDHWPEVNCALIAGGGIRGGQVIGATTRDAGSVRERPIDFQEVVATLYHVLGIDVGRTTLTDPTGRPQYLVQRGPIRELVG
jgi:hypothetical protein